MKGAGRIGRLTTAATWYRGVFRELPLGHAPAADVNGNGRNTDEFPVVVVRASDGWVVFIDTNLDGSFEDEMPLHDYRQGRETIALGTKPLTIVANFSGSDSVPVLDLFFDTSGDRKSTRLNSSHGYISYAVFCLKKKKTSLNTIHGYISDAVFCLQKEM